MWSFIVFLGFLLTLSPEVLQAQDASQSTWSVLKEWSGEEPSTTIETERFTTASRTFRISWNATPLREKTGGVVDVSVPRCRGRGSRSLEPICRAPVRSMSLASQAFIPSRSAARM